jgi:hypothetical protein
MEFLIDILRQLTGTSFRSGKFSIGFWAHRQMTELGLDSGTLEDVFRHGRKVTSIIQDYGDYSVSIGYRWDENKKCYVITSCRKFKNEFRKGVK